MNATNSAIAASIHLRPIAGDIAVMHQGEDILPLYIDGNVRETTVSWPVSERIEHGVSTHFARSRIDGRSGPLLWHPNPHISDVFVVDTNWALRVLACIAVAGAAAVEQAKRDQWNRVAALTMKLADQRQKRESYEERRDWRTTLVGAR